MFGSPKRGAPPACAWPALSNPAAASSTAAARAIRRCVRREAPRTSRSRARLWVASSKTRAAASRSAAGEAR